MKIIVCLDDNGGMTFNNRRQSRDRVLIDDVIATVGDTVLYIDEYSMPLFEGKGANIVVSADMPRDAGMGEYCFVENKPISDFFDIQELVIYRWNRIYPRDLTFDLDLEKNGFSLVSSCEFAGYSHEKITKEIFRK